MSCTRRNQISATEITLLFLWGINWKLEDLIFKTGYNRCLQVCSDKNHGFVEKNIKKSLKCVNLLWIESSSMLLFKKNSHNTTFISPEVRQGLVSQLDFDPKSCRLFSKFCILHLEVRGTISAHCFTYYSLYQTALLLAAMVHLLSRRKSKKEQFYYRTFHK